MNLYLIEELWQAAMENDTYRACGYLPVCVTSDPDVWEKLGSEVVPANGWPLTEDTPRFRIVKLPVEDYPEKLLLRALRT